MRILIVPMVLIAALLRPAAAGAQELEHIPDRSLRFPFEVGAEDAAAALEARVELEYSTDEGRSWHLAASTPARREHIDWTAPADGRYGFRLVAIDAVGNREPASGAERQVMIDTRSPEVELLEPDAGYRYKAGADMVIDWRVGDEHLGKLPVRMRYAINNEATLHPLGEAYPASMEEPKARLYLPADTWSARIVVTATDLAGNEGVAQFYVGRENIYPPEMDPVRIMGLPEATPYRKVELSYGVDSRYEAGLERVELFISSDGGVSWDPSGLVDGAVGRRLGRFEYQAATDGVYGFRLLAHYERGYTATPRPGPNMKPQGVILVDSVAPRLELEMPIGGALVWHGGERYELAWLAGDNVKLPLEFRVEYSQDAGAEGSWKDLGTTRHIERASDDAPLPDWSRAIVPQRFRMPWVLPYFEAKDFRVRIRAEDLAGNLSYAESGRIQVRGGTPPPAVEPGLGPPEGPGEDIALHEARWHLARGNRQGYLDALALYDAILEREPSRMEALMDRGHARFQLKRYGEALEDFRKASALSPRDPAPYLNEAACYLAMGNKARTAVRLFRDRLMEDVSMYRSLSDDQATELVRGMLEAARQLAWYDRPAAERAKAPIDDIHEAERILARALALEDVDSRLVPDMEALRAELLQRLRGSP